MTLDMVPHEVFSRTQYTNEKWQHQHTILPNWAEHYWQTREWRSRDVVLAAIDRIRPVRTVMEIGCHVGPMLERIATSFPEIALFGVDTNTEFVKEAQKRVPSATVSQANLMTWLPGQASQSWDVVVTHYTLAYVAPRDIASVLSQCLRIAKKSLICAEPTGPSLMIHNYPEWQHDYPRILRELGARRIDQAPIASRPNKLNTVTQVLL